MSCKDTGIKKSELVGKTQFHNAAYIHKNRDFVKKKDIHRIFSWPSSGKASCESSGQSSTGAVCAAGRTDMNIMDMQIQRSNPPPHNILPEKENMKKIKIKRFFCKSIK